VRGWRITVRTGPRVEHARPHSAAEALEELFARTRVAIAGARRGTVDLRYRRYEPSEQVVARAELRGPRGLRAGLDVHGDGDVQAWTGRLRRRPLEGDDPFDAVRDLVQSTSVEP
jgi:hypothetical protein